MTKKAPAQRPESWPVWYDGKSINEALFCQQFLATHKLAFTENAFFTVSGRMVDESLLQKEIYRLLEPFATTSVTRKITSIIELLKITAHVDDLPPQADRIHVANGTLMLDGSFSPAMDEIVRSRFPVRYNLDAASPERWMSFLDALLHPEDIPTLQEYIGYCLIPSNKGQRMMVIKGSGGEGKVSENRFARADLEHST